MGDAPPTHRARVLQVLFSFRVGGSEIFALELARQLAESGVQVQCGALVGEHGEEGLFVRDLAGQRVGHANGARGVGLHQRIAFFLMRKNVVYQDAPVKQVDAAALRGEICAVELKVARVADDGGHALALEAGLKDFELAPGGHLAPIQNGDLRCFAVAGPLLIRIQ